MEMEKELPEIPGFPGYFYSVKEKKVYSSKSGKYLSSRFSGRRTKFELYRKNKCCILYDDQLKGLTIGKSNPSPFGRKILDYPNYKITKDGKVHSIKTERPLTPLHQHGYNHYRLYRNGKCTQVASHRLVAKAYIPNPHNYKVVNHKNGVKTDNRVENLEWCTKKHDVIHAHETGLNKGSKRAVLQIKVVELHGEVLTFKSIADAARNTGISGGSICVACKKGRKTRGYTWRYLGSNPRSGKAQEIEAIKLIPEEWVVHEFESAEVAGKAMGIHPSGINKVCRGKQKLAKGFKWRYVNKSKDEEIKEHHEWKPIPGFSRYKISTDGEVYSMIYNRKLEAQDHDGYCAISMINDEGKRKSMRVHRLVSMTYHANPQKKRVVNHKDGIKDNNTHKNLEWATDSENTKHAMDTGLCNRRKPVIQYSLEGKEIGRYKSAWEASKKMNVTHASICNACRGYSKTCKGYKWEYVEDAKD